MPQRLFLAAVLAVSLPALVQAQYLKGGPMGRQQPNAQQAMVQGTIQAMSQGGHRGARCQRPDVARRNPASYKSAGDGYGNAR